MSDAWFYAAALPAVLIYGVSKGGFGGGLGVAAVPIMSLTVSPTFAAAVLLPVLVFMDAIGLRAYFGKWDGPALKAMLPGAGVGIALASLSFGYLSDDAVRLLLGVIATVFALNHFLKPAAKRVKREPDAKRAALWGTVAGFTSTLAHSGGPPANIYLLPLGLDRTTFVATMVVLFAALNAIKLVPYALLGLFEASTLWAALTLLPVAGLGMGLGIWLHSRVNETLFFTLCYAFVLITGLKLIHDGLT